MGDINLLPEELREKEKRELESVQKLPKKVRIEMTSPTPEAKPQPLKQPKPSLMSRLFAKKIKPTKPIKPIPTLKAPKAPDLDISRPTKKVLHIPKPEKSSTKTQDVVKRFSFGQKEKTEKFESPKDLSVPTTSDIKIEDRKLVPPSEKTIEIKEKAKKPSKKFTINLFGWLKPKRSKRIKDVDKSGKKDKPEDVKNEKDLEKEKSEEKKPGFEVNLIPKDLVAKQQLELPKKMFISGLFVFIAILVVGTAYLGITWYQLNVDRQLDQLQAEIEDINDQIAQQEKFKLTAIDLQDRLKMVKELLNNHIYWTKFFELLEKHTIPEVYFTDFSMSGTERIALSAVGRDYESVAKQLIIFQNADDLVASVEINAASAVLDEDNNYDQVNFNIDLTFLPQVFTKPIN